MAASASFLASSESFLGGNRTDAVSGIGFWLSPDLRRLSSSSVQISVRRRIHLPRRSLVSTLTGKTIYKKTEVRAAGDTFEKHFEVATYGESHEGGVGCVISGCPPGIPLSKEDLQFELDRRRPGQSPITTPREETNTCQIHSGIYDGMTTGTSISVFVPNKDQRGHDYDEMSSAYRPSYADAAYDFKDDLRATEGGGRSSARETIGRVVAGAIAKMILKMYAGTEILAYVSQMHKVVLPEGVVDNETVTLDQIESSIVRCPDPEYAQKMISAINAVRVRGDSVGGIVACIARNVPRVNNLSDFFLAFI